jgi:hypothetical protein
MRLDDNDTDDRLVERLVTFPIEYEGRIIIIENVPERVDPETGEQFCAAKTVKRLQAIVWSGRKPDRVAQTPGFEFAG